MGGAYSAPRAVPTKWFGDFEATLPALAGKAVAVTGSTTGTGLVLARACAKKGAHVLLLNRPSPRAAAAAAAVGAVCARGARVTAVDCDLNSFASVRAAAARVLEVLDGGGLDVLVNNAGVMALADEATADGYDVQMQPNHLSHFLLTRELFPALERAGALRGEARIVNHSSGARFVPGGPLDAAYLGKGGALGGDGASMFFGGARWVRYHHTKLANAVFTVALDARLRAAGSRVKALCAAPGLAATNLQVTTAAAGGFGATWIMAFAQSAEDGTMPLAAAALAPGAAGGDIYEPRNNAITGPPARAALAAEKYAGEERARAVLWAASEAAVGPWAL
jgi:NAD(P)-dependent dehydrogenase (short-subunit alcohol dehydrogenase family)